jgi:hypothetical protein
MGVHPDLTMLKALRGAAPAPARPRSSSVEPFTHAVGPGLMPEER